LLEAQGKGWAGLATPSTSTIPIFHWLKTKGIGVASEMASDKFGGGKWRNQAERGLEQCAQIPAQRHILPQTRGKEQGRNEVHLLHPLSNQPLLPYHPI
jgi:hypothetical protein